jgi:hypothetical protein
MDATSDSRRDPSGHYKEVRSMTSPIPTKSIEVDYDNYDSLQKIRRRLTRQRKKYYQHKYPDMEIDPDPTYVSFNDVVSELLEVWDFEKSPRKPLK